MPGSTASTAPSTEPAGYRRPDCRMPFPTAVMPSSVSLTVRVTPDDRSSSSAIVGVLLAAGAGSRMGMPKALVVDEGGSWLDRATRLLLDSECTHVIVVLGAEAAKAGALLPRDARVIPVVAANWRLGMSASLTVALGAAARTDAAAALITLVYLPRLPRAALDRVSSGTLCSSAGTTGNSSSAASLGTMAPATSSSATGSSRWTVTTSGMAATGTNLGRHLARGSKTLHHNVESDERVELVAATRERGVVPGLQFG